MLLASVVLVPRLAGADNVTVSGDVARTGWDANEPGLTPSDVSSSDFGQQWSAQLVGSIYSQPLVIGNTVVVTTEKARAYGLDAATGAVLWQRTFGAPFQASSIGCGDLTPDLGSTSTPVYDAAGDTVYLTTKLADGSALNDPHWYLQAISATTGATRPGYPMRLQGTAVNDPSVTFNPFLSMQRPGLLLANGVVYIGFGSHCDIGSWKGWVMAVDVNGQPSIKSAWVSEGLGTAGGGIWGAGGGLVSDGNDANGNPRVFISTGNGLSPEAVSGSTPQTFYGDAVVRLGLNTSGQLAANDWFAPSDAPRLQAIDADLAAGAPAALPNSFGTPSHPKLLVEAGKDGRVFLLDRNDLGGRSQGPGGTDAVVQTLGPFEGIWGHPAVYGDEGGYVYYAGSLGPLRAYARGVTGGGNPALSMVASSSQTFNYGSGSPIVTSSGPGTALVWIVHVAGYADGDTLRAYDAKPSAGVLTLRWSAPIGNASKFEMPATSNGRVFVGSKDGKIFAFGRPATTPLTTQYVNFGQVAVGSTGTATAHMVANTAITISAATATAPFAANVSGLPVTLGPGGAFDLPLSFAPTSAGSKSSTVKVTTTSGLIAFDVSGTATMSGLSATPTQLAFGTVTTSLVKSLTVNITNTGTTNATITSTSSPSAPFTATGVPSVGTVVAPQQSIAIPVSYAPVVGGASAGTLQINSDSGSVTVALTGTGQSGQGSLALSTTSLQFGSVTIGTSHTLSFDVLNTGNIPISITKAKAPGGSFSSANQLPEGLTLAPDDVFHQQVTFTPVATGPVTATYSITADDGNGAQVVTLNATGVIGTTLASPNPAGWTLNGHASLEGDDLVLTPPDVFIAGSAFTWATLPSNGLHAHFTAQISNGTGADGMAFVIADAAGEPNSIGYPGGGLGYGGIANALAVTLDTFQGPGDPSGNFVGVAQGTQGAPDRLNYITTSSNIRDLRSGPHDVDVDYYNGRLHVAVDGQPQIDVAVTLPTNVRPGFSAGTGGLVDRHAVRNVVISTPSLVPGPVAVFTSPLPGDVLIDPGVARVAVTDNVAITGVQFFVDGLAAGPVQTAGPYQVSLDTSVLSVGAHNVSVSVTDAAGLQFVSRPTPFTVALRPVVTPGWSINDAAHVELVANHRTSVTLDDGQG